MAVDSCFWTVQEEDIQENILGKAISVCNRYSEQSVSNLTQKKDTTTSNF